MCVPSDVARVNGFLQDPCFFDSSTRDPALRKPRSCCRNPSVVAVCTAARKATATRTVKGKTVRPLSQSYDQKCAKNRSAKHRATCRVSRRMMTNGREYLPPPRADRGLGPATSWVGWRPHVEVVTKLSVHVHASVSGREVFSPRVGAPTKDTLQPESVVLRKYCVGPSARPQQRNTSELGGKCS